MGAIGIDVLLRQALWAKRVVPMSRTIFSADQQRKQRMSAPSARERAKQPAGD
jgi:hypothetical protein